MKKLFAFTLLALVAFGLACSTGTRVSRIQPTEVTDLSGRWNDTDSRLVSEKMVSEMLGLSWYDEWLLSKSKKPVVIVGRVKNESTEHISSTAFIADIERSLINSGKIAFTSGGAERDELRAERRDQLTNASEETIKQFGREIGADLMLFGSIVSFEDQAGGVKAVTYQIDMYLVDIEKNLKVWVGQKKIKKIIERSRFRL